MHICQGGERAGQECMVINTQTDANNQCQIVEPPGCPNGTCVVKYVLDQKARNDGAPTPNLPLLAHGTLTIIVDDSPVIKPGSQVRTILLEVTQPEFDPQVDEEMNPQAGQPHFLANIIPVGRESEFSELGILAMREVDEGGFRFPDTYLFRQVSEAGTLLAQRLRDMFGAPSNSIPVIADVRSPQVPVDNTDNPLGTVVSLRVEIGFAYLHPGASPTAAPEE
jgi:hypothetical protein